jgi:hypothetical protein
MTLNFVQIETKTGIKEFELVHVDITALSFQVDVICISAFKGDYTPTSSSIVGQFYTKGIDIGQLSKSPAWDFKESLGIWVSHDVNSQQFKNILCVEITGTNNSFKESIQNLFAVISALEIQGQKNYTIAIPMIGAGDQNFQDDLVISTLLEVSLDFLKYSRFLNKIYFVEYNQEKASAFNVKMNHVLGRVKIKSPSGELAQLLRRNLNTSIDLLIEIHPTEDIFADLKRVINSEFRPFEFGAIARKTIERIIFMMNPKSDRYFELVKKIDALQPMLSVSQWIQSYFHTIRILGNEAVHAKHPEKRTPAYVDEKDLEIGMYCLSRIIDFYLSQNTNRQEQL